MEIISIGFISLTIGSYALLVKIIFDALAKTEWPDTRKRKFRLILLISLIGWAIFISAWSASGRMGDFTMFPLNMLPVLAIPMIAILFFTFSKSTKPIIEQLPQQSLVTLQSFRFLVELLLWRLFVLNQMPIQMSFEGRNWDVLSGLSAIVVAFLIGKGKISKTGLLFWNLAGLALLANILTIAILSMPTPFRVFMNEPSNTIVTQFPVSLLPAFLVPLAYGLHFLSLRKLVIDK